MDQPQPAGGWEVDTGARNVLERGAGHLAEAPLPAGSFRSSLPNGGGHTAPDKSIVHSVGHAVHPASGRPLLLAPTAFILDLLYS